MNAVAFVRPARHNLAQENNLLVPFPHRDIEITHSAALLRQLRQFVIMRREQGARFDLIVQKFRDAPRNRKPVECRCSAPDLIQNYQAALGRIVHNVRRLVHLHHKRRSATCEIVARADPCENTIDQPDLRARRRHEAADLREQHNQRHLPDVSGFARHIRASNNCEPHFAVERRIVRHKFFFHQILVEHRMPAVLDRESQRIVQCRPAVIKKPRRFREPAGNIENCNCLSCLLDWRKLAQRLFA